MLAEEWGRQRGFSLLTVLQTVSFFNGKALIDATMLRAMAETAGYTVDVESGDDAATVTISKGGVVLGAQTYRLNDARQAGLTNKDVWKKHPRAMLVARATTEAMRYHAPSVVVGIATDEEVESYDAPPGLPEPVVETAEPVVETAEPVVEVAELIEWIDEDPDYPVSDATWKKLNVGIRKLGPRSAELIDVATAANVDLEARSTMVETDALWLIDQTREMLARDEK